KLLALRAAPAPGVLPVPQQPPARGALGVRERVRRERGGGAVELPLRAARLVARYEHVLPLEREPLLHLERVRPVAEVRSAGVVGAERELRPLRLRQPQEALARELVARIDLD